jgi:solute carrier family 25 (adenine nucleotide translocator) protein 4/5/6/31
MDVGKPNDREFKTTRAVWSRVIEKDGYRGLYRGIAVSSLGVFVYRGLYFGLFDSLRPMVVTKKNNNIFAMWMVA